MSSRRNAENPRGFTLVELLVVIGIIALLISILMPALANARRSARETQCLSNVRQLTIAMIGYATEHKGKTFQITGNSPDSYWHHQLAPYFGDANYAATADNYQGAIMRVMVCPEATEPPGSGWMATRFETWHWNSGYGSYGINLWVIPDYPEYNGDIVNIPRSGFFPLLPLKSETPIFGDSIWVGSWPDNNDTVYPNQPNGWFPHQRGEFMGRFCFDRHRKAINVGFGDGSARRTPLAELWTLKWNRDSVPKNVTPPIP